MIIKQCQFSGRDTNGEYIHLLHAGYDNSGLVKTASSVASPPQLGIIQRFMKGLPRQNGKLYTLISALGAGEYYGSNSNADYFGEGPLLHVPPGWSDLSHSQQIAVGKRWEWGYPTFYNAHAFAHHVNKDPNRAFGSIEYTSWDPHMKRVLLVVAFDRARAVQFGSSSVLDKVENGEFPPVSMGTRVPFDLCSKCFDFQKYQHLMDRPAQLVAMHKQRPIQGLSTTTQDYCHHLKNELNKIYPDGRKVVMMNMHPRFFDLSVVFIGADKTSFILAKLAGECPIKPGTKECGNCRHTDCVPSSHVHEVWSRGMDKAAFDQTGASISKDGKTLYVPTLGEQWGRHLKSKTAGLGGWIKRNPMEAGLTGVGLLSGATLGGKVIQTRRKRSVEKPARPKSTAERLAEESYRGGSSLASREISRLKREDPEKYRSLLKQPPSVFMKHMEQRGALSKEAEDYLGDLEWEDPKVEGKINDYLKRKRMQVGRIKTSALSKDAEIIKQVQSNFRKSMPKLIREEPRMGQSLEDVIAEKMSDGLSTAGSLGIVAKPREFQRMYIRAIGRPGLADELDSKGLMFRTGAPPSDDFSLSESIVPKILKALLPMMAARSSLTPSIGRRTIIMIKCSPKHDIEEESGCSEMDHPLMDKISSAYSAYRRDLLYKSPKLIKQAAFAHPEIYHALYGDEVLRQGLVKVGADVMESVIGVLTSTYLNEAYMSEPISAYVGTNCDRAGLEKAAGLAVLGGVV